MREQYVGFQFKIMKDKHEKILQWSYNMRDKKQREILGKTVKDLLDKLAKKKYDSSILLLHCKSFINDEYSINAIFQQGMEYRWSRLEFNDLRDKIIKTKMTSSIPNQHGFCDKYKEPTHKIWTCIKVYEANHAFQGSKSLPQQHHHASKRQHHYSENQQHHYFQKQQHQHQFATTTPQYNAYIAAHYQQQQQQLGMHVYPFYQQQLFYQPLQKSNYMFGSGQMQQGIMNQLKFPMPLPQYKMSNQPIINNITINNNYNNNNNENHYTEIEQNIKEMKQQLQQQLQQHEQNMNQKMDKVSGDVVQLKKNIEQTFDIVTKIFQNSKNNQDMMQELEQKEITKVAVINQLVDNIKTLELCIKSMEIKKLKSETIDEMMKQSINNINKTVKQAAEDGDSFADTTLKNIKNIKNLNDIKNDRIRNKLEKGKYASKCDRYNDVPLNLAPSKIAIQNEGELCVPVVLITHLNIMGQNGSDIIYNHIANQSAIKFRKYVSPHHDIRLYHSMQFRMEDQQYYFGLKEIFCDGITSVDEDINTFEGLCSLITNDTEGNDACMIIIRKRNTSYAHCLVAYPYAFIKKNNIVTEECIEENMILFISCDISLNATINQIPKQIWMENISDAHETTKWPIFLDGCDVSHVYQICISKKKENIAFHRPMTKSICEANINNNSNNKLSQSQYKHGDIILVAFNESSDTKSLELWPAQIIKSRILDLSKLKDDRQDEDIDILQNKIINQALSLFVSKQLVIYYVRYLQIISSITQDLELDQHDQWVLEQQCFQCKQEQFTENKLEYKMAFKIGSWHARDPPAIENDHKRSRKTFENEKQNESSPKSSKKRKYS